MASGQLALKTIIIPINTRIKVDISKVKSTAFFP